MIFFVAVAVAVAAVESHMANEGYYEIDEEQAVFRTAARVFEYARACCRTALPTRDLQGWSW
jgi:hypothetical protein